MNSRLKAVVSLLAGLFAWAVALIVVCQSQAGIGIDAVHTTSENRLLLHYDFEHDLPPNVFDQAGRNDGTSSNLVYCAGPVGRLAADFTQYGSIRVTNVPGLEITNSAYTISWWLKYNGLPVEPAERAIGAKLARWPSYFYTADDESFFARTFAQRLDIYTVQLKHGNTFLSPEVNFAASNWVHFAAVFTGSKLQLYTNAALCAEIETTEILSTQTNSFTIGPQIWYGFIGFIDDFRLYDYALTSAELEPIVNLKNSGRILSISRSSGSVELSWSTVASPGFLLESSDTIDSLQWQAVDAPLNEEKGMASVLQTGDQSAGFYRLRVSPGSGGR